jgi:putative ATP-dependent endonuclease of the OLD family
VTLAHCDGRAESELEDLYAPAVYEKEVQTRYGVVLSGPKFRNAKKWSVRVRDTFEQQGKPWSERLEREVKGLVAETAAARATTALVPETRHAFDALVLALRERLDIAGAETRRAKC